MINPVGPRLRRFQRCKSVNLAVARIVLICRDEVYRITVCMVGVPRLRMRTSEPRDRTSCTLAASVHQADIDYDTWSSRRGNPRKYPPIGAPMQVLERPSMSRSNGMICGNAADSNSSWPVVGRGGARCVPGNLYAVRHGSFRPLGRGTGGWYEWNCPVSVELAGTRRASSRYARLAENGTFSCLS